MEFSLCGQYRNKYDKFVNIEDSLLLIHENMQEMCLKLWNSAEYGI